MAVDDNPPQLVTSLPEIIGKITSFLPISDLLTCTKVNAGWEREARNHIRARSVFSGRFLGYYESYGEVMSVRTSYYETMRINWEYNQELDDFLPRFKNLAEQCTGKVRHLTLSVFLDGGKRPMEFFRIIKLFGNHLTSLQFTFFTKLDVFYDRQNTYDTEDASAFLADFNPGKDLIFPFITKLSLYTFNIANTAIHPIILAKIAPLFPAVTHIGFSFPRLEVFEFLFRTNPTLFPKLTSLADKNPYKCPDVVDDRAFMTNQLSWYFSPQISRLEFDMSNHEPTCGTSLMKIFAPLLQRLHIEISNQRIGQQENSTVLYVPIMPRLQVFKIRRYAFGCSTEFNRCEVGVKFETEDPANNVMLNYAKQFPVLAVLSVKYLNRKDEDTEVERAMHFESTVKFLYDSFTPGGDGVRCETLRDLDVPLPPMEMFRLRGVKAENICQNRICKCYGWQSSTKFLDRISGTFPNLRYHVFDEIRSKVVKGWIQVGLDLGVLKKPGNGEGEIRLNIGGVRKWLNEF
ncbi:uncharacterized protein LOC118437460 isoform X1 [Folsomia candida]|uniref:uncharacterized protein LOC118437460 isoform X1 n=1 Tax=Folsomia candida TaxID=158441 RepID=UPI001605242B|nr:uncharacterized protein LOC118437460 isoform X1 [Folsomia candida]XP_035712368.1 uncharacterized protein LOC118437460 isoform X1 [Folsomia candida]